MAEATHNCGLDSYARNLQLVHATSDNPIGPYTKQGLVAAPIANTAHLARDPADGALLLFVTGCGTAAARGCTQIEGCHNGTTDNPMPTPPASCNNLTRCQDDDGTNVLRSPNGLFEGPWELAVSPLLDTDDPRKQHADNTTVYYANPAPLIDDDGTTRIIFRDFYRNAQFPRTNLCGLAKAKQWRGPYALPLGNDGTVVPNATEDPHLYRDHRGHCHVIFHALDHWCYDCQCPTATSTKLCEDTVGGHAFSRDCEHFRFSHEYAFTSTVEFTDGSSYTFQRRERPEAILKDGHVIGLVSGVSDTRQQQASKGSRRDYSWTLVQPVKTHAKP